MNKITIFGRLTKDVEMFTTQGGTSYAKFSIACNAKRKNADGSRKVDYFDCVAFNKGGEILAEYIHKGDAIMVIGTMESNKKDDRTYWNVVVEDFDFATGATKQTSGVVEETTPAGELPF